MGPNSETISSFPAFHFEKINIGTHRLSVFWNARKSRIKDSYDVAVKNLLLTVNNEGDWTLESDQQTEVSTMTVEQFNEKYPTPPKGTEESFPSLHQSRNMASDLKKVRLFMGEANSSKVGSEAKSIKSKFNWTAVCIALGFIFLFIIIHRFTKTNQN